jgi:hypothetical protein
MSVSNASELIGTGLGRPLSSPYWTIDNLPRRIIRSNYPFSSSVGDHRSNLGVSRSGRKSLSCRPDITFLWRLSAPIATRPAFLHPRCTDPADSMSFGLDPLVLYEPRANRFVRPDRMLDLRWHVPESSYGWIAPDIGSTLESLRFAPSGKAWSCD